MSEIRATGGTQTHAPVIRGDRAPQLIGQRVGEAELLRTLEGHAGWVNAVAVTPDGLRAVSASDDGSLKMWDLQSGRELRILEGHAGPVSAVAVTPYGRRAVSAS